MNTKIFFFVLLVIAMFGCKKDTPTQPAQQVDPKPVVKILSPSNNATILDSTFIEIEATDDKGITKVELYIDNQMVKYYTSLPFKYLWSIITQPDSSSHTIYAKAYDADGNVTVSSNIIVMIFRARPTNLKITSLLSGQVSMVWVDNCKIETEYVIEMSSDSGATYIVLKHLPSNSTTSTFTSTFIVDKRYFFRVGAKINSSFVYSNHSSKVCASIAMFITTYTTDGGGSSVQQTSDGGFIIAGTTGANDVCLIKTDVIGNKSWEKNYGGSGDDAGSSAQQTSDGGFIITGRTKSFGSGLYDVYLVKTDASGNKSWEKTFGGSGDDVGNSVQQTSDGGFIIVGDAWITATQRTFVYLIKTDISGNKTWEKYFERRTRDFGNSIKQTSDGGYIITGYTWDSSPDGGIDSVYLIKADANGNKSWEKTFSYYNGHDYGNSVQQTSDGGFIVTGSTWLGTGNKYNVYLIKTDANGNKTWEKTFGYTDNEEGTSVKQTTDGGFIIVGTTSSIGAGGRDIYLIKTDGSGNETWFKTYGGNSDDYASSVQQTSDGGFIITGGINGWFYNDDYKKGIFLIKTNKDGNVLP